MEGMNRKTMVMVVEDAGFDAMNEDTESFTTVEESAPSKKCKKEQAAVKQKSMSLKKVNQVEIMGAEFDVMKDMSKVLNKSKHAG